MDEFNNPEILSDAEVSSFNSSSLKEILKKSTTSSVVERLLIVSLTVICSSVWEKILKFKSNIIINTNLVLYISKNIFNYYNN